jgi:polyisoprenoid-binding protein YceI
VPRFDAASAECLVFAFREGLLSAVGHDVCLRVTSFVVDVGDGDVITADFDAGSLRVEGQVNALDRRQIERNAANDVLDARRFPKIAFRSTKVTRDGARARIEGELTLHGATQPIALDAADDGQRWRAEVRLDQRRFGIRPYSAMLGTLKVKPEVVVRISLPRA